MFQIKVAEQIKTHILRPIIFFSKNCAVYEMMWKHVAEPDRPQVIISHSACDLHAGKLRLQTHLFIFQDKSGYANAPQCYVIRTLLLFQSQSSP
jgi:hypothetical protein